MSFITRNFLMTFFSHRPFYASHNGVSPRGAKIPKSTANVEIGGGAKILTFRKIYTTIVILYYSDGGPTSIANFDGGMPGLAPPGSATGHVLGLPPKSTPMT